MMPIDRVKCFSPFQHTIGRSALRIARSCWVLYVQELREGCGNPLQGMRKQSSNEKVQKACTRQVAKETLYLVSCGREKG